MKTTSTPFRVRELPKGLLAVLLMFFMQALSFTAFAQMTATTITPRQGFVGDSATLAGTGLSAVTNVYFTGTAGTQTLPTTFRPISNNSMWVFVPPGARLGTIKVQNVNASIGGTATSNQTYNPRALVKTFTPMAGLAGTFVSVKGTSFYNVTQVLLGTNSMAFTVVSDSLITFTVPAGSVSGAITLRVTGHEVTNSTAIFVISANAPVITSFLPVSGPVGTAVTIKGLHFIGTNAVRFTNNKPANFVVLNDTTIIATVPTGAVTGAITVQTTNNGTAVSSSSFQVTVAPPVITSFTPAQGSAGTTITIHGHYFSNATKVEIANQNVGSYTVIDDSTITAVVSPTNRTGVIQVTNSAGVGVSATTFVVVNPIDIYSFSPASGPVGTVVTIKGQGFTSQPAVRSVLFGNTPATVYTIVNDTTIIATVPVGAISGIISVISPRYAATGSSSYVVTVPVLSITNFSPQSGPVGTQVTIHGTNFLAVFTVVFGGPTQAAFTKVNDTTIIATVPTGAITGLITVVITGTNFVQTTSSFTVTSGLPTISSFTPSSGPPGTVVTVSGTNFIGVTNVLLNNANISTYTVNSPTSISFTVPVGATTGLIKVNTAAGSATSATDFTVTPGATFTGFSPGSGIAGSTVTITGTLLNTITQVMFNGVAASFTIVDANTITATVPPGATTGLITLNTPTGNLSSTSSFIVTFPPTIVDFTPTSGTAGTTVTITGNNFIGLTGVLFNGTAAVFTVVNANTVSAVVPSGASTGPITVSTGTYSSTSTADFTVLVPPTITSFTPTSGPAGTSVTLTGTSFVGTTSVTIGTLPTAFTVVNASTITLTIPAGASTNAFTVTTNQGAATSAGLFTVYQLPVITGFNPVTGGAGATVTITGSNFNGATQVSFNGRTATFVIVDANTITVTVPAGASTGPISVTGPAGTATSANSFTFIPAPTIASFTPATGPEGTLVTISGANFTGATDININGLTGAFTVVNNSTATLLIPTGATSGPLEITTPGGTAVSATVFTVVPVPTITSFSPVTGPIGTVVAISGTNFIGFTTVAFNGTSAVFTILNGNTISATVPTGSSTGKITVTTAGGTATSALDFTVIQAPTITSFSPAFGWVGTSVTITGTNFSNASLVQFNGSNAVYTVNNAQTITATVPAGATTGLIKIVTPGGTAISVNAFTVYPAPAITSFTPASGPIGTVVTLTGTNFISISAVTLNGAAVPYTLVNNTTITLTVPAGATSGLLRATNGGGTAVSPGSFTVIPAPVITSFNPAAGPTGTTVNITGSNFTGATFVTFNGVSASSFVVLNSTTITVTVPASATTGPLSVTTPGGVAVSSTDYTVIPAPAISGINPSTGFAGTVFTITGTNLNGATSVTINGVSSGFTVVNSTTVTVTVPVGAATGTVTITTPGGSATGTVFTVIPAPVISSFTPNKGYVGTPVTISGSNFVSVSSVKFNGVTAAFTLVNAGSISTNVPAGATTGRITVTTPGGTAQSSSNFTVIPAPTISSFTPTSGFVGNTVVVSGTNLAGTTTAMLGTLAVSFSVVNDNTVNITVPSGAVTAFISLSTPGGTATSASQFTVNGAPTITNFTPVSGAEGTVVTVNGSGYIAVSQVTIGGVNASFTVSNTGTLVFTIPAGAVDGPITVTNPAGTATSTNVFTVTAPLVPTYCIPVQSGVSPCVGTLISAFSITGTSLNNNPINCPATSGTSYSIFPQAGNYTDTLKRSVAYTLKITTGGPSSSAVAVWIDYNQNGQYDATEMAYSFPLNASGSTLTATVNIPSSAMIGTTGLRIRSRITGASIAATDACADFASGETQDYFVTIGYAPAPTITSFTPGSGLPNTTVTITGTNFNTATAVYFNGVAASFSITANNTIVAQVPAGAGTGPITVVTQGGTGTSATSFVYIVPLTISTAAVNETLCAGDSVTVSFSSTGIFNGANRFVAELSDENGSFSFPTPLGTVTATSGSIRGKLPRNLADGGAYLVRVISTAPVISAADNFSPISIHALPQVIAGANETHCALDAPYTLTGFSPTGGTWTGTGVNTTGTFNPATAALGSNLLLYTYTNGNGCTDTATKRVTVNASPVKATVTLTGSATFCQGDSVTLSGPAGASQYTWSNGETTQSIKVRLAGVLTLTTTNAAGCQSPASDAVTVTVLNVPAQPAVTLTGNATFCAGDSLTLTAPGGFPAYLWSTGEATQAIKVKTAGPVSVKVQNANGCFSASSVTTDVVVNPLPSVPVITVDGNTTFCFGDSATLNAPGSYSSYAWSNGQTTQGIRIKASGTFTVRVTNANGCQSPASAAVAVTVNPEPALPTITASAATTFCQGDSVDLSGPAGFSAYLWSTGANTATIRAKQSGVYTLSVVNANGCTSQTSAATQVTVNPTPGTPSITAGGNTSFCPGDSLTLTATAGYNTYVWSNGASGRSIKVGATGNYSVHVFSTEGCRSAESQPASVTVFPRPAQPIVAGGNPTFCQGDSVRLRVTQTFAHYLWSNGDTTSTIIVRTSGSYSVTVFNANGCASFRSNPTAITVFPTPATPSVTVTGLTTFCQGDSVMLSGPDGFSSYLWSNGTRTQTFAAKLSNAYTLRVVNASGCTSGVSVPVNVTVNSKPATPDVTANGPTSFCDGGSVTLSAPAGYTYLWSNNATTQSITVNQTGNFSVHVTNLSLCQSPESEVTAVTNLAVPATPVIMASGPLTFCTGGSVTLSTAVPYAHYRWSTGDTTASITVSAAFGYAVQVYNANGCGSSLSAPVLTTVNPLPVRPVIEASGNVDFCAGGNVTLGGPAGASGYVWSNGATTQSITVNAAGTYTVQTINASGCTSLASPPIVTSVLALPAAPTVTVSGNTTFCAGGSVSLDGPSGFAAYIWSNGATTQTNTVTASGNYTLMVVNAAGCTSAASTATVITVSTMPDVTVTVTGIIDTQNRIYSVPSAAGITYQWLFNGVAIPGADKDTLLVSCGDPEGNYSVRVSNGICTDTSEDQMFICVGVAKQLASFGLVVYPNPSTGVFNIDAADLPTGKLEATITDALGRLVYAKTLESNNRQLDLTGMPNGIYHLNVIAGSKHAAVRLTLQR
ncbi:MAG: IPT/TIG domain-containing protein [Bacteroidota bacterium]